MNFINPLLAGLQMFKFNFATNDARLTSALIQIPQNNQKMVKQDQPKGEVEEIIKTEDLYKLQALTQQEIIKRQLLENMMLIHQQQSVYNQLAQRGSEVLIEKPSQEDDSNDKVQSKKIKKTNTCGHNDKEHYAKGMCNNCYHRFGRNKKPWLCEHVKLYACGLCQNCYINKYNKKRRIQQE